MGNQGCRVLTHNQNCCAVCNAHVLNQFKLEQMQLPPKSLSSLYPGLSVHAYLIASLNCFINIASFILDGLLSWICMDLPMKYSLSLSVSIYRVFSNCAGFNTAGATRLVHLLRLSLALLLSSTNATATINATNCCYSKDGTTGMQSTAFVKLLTQRLEGLL